jgi:hypothetical protein
LIYCNIWYERAERAPPYRGVPALKEEQ